jgi:hypothetical protein
MQQSGHLQQSRSVKFDESFNSLNQPPKQLSPTQSSADLPDIQFEQASPETQIPSANGPADPSPSPDADGTHPGSNPTQPTISSNQPASQQTKENYLMKELRSSPGWQNAAKHRREDQADHSAANASSAFHEFDIGPILDKDVAEQFFASAATIKTNISEPLTVNEALRSKHQKE